MKDKLDNFKGVKVEIPDDILEKEFTLKKETFQNIKLPEIPPPSSIHRGGESIDISGKIGPFNRYRRLDVFEREQAELLAEALYEILESGQSLSTQPIPNISQPLTVNILARLVSQESAGKPTAKSVAGAQGLGQIMPKTGAEIAAKYFPGEKWNPEDPKMNLRASAIYITELHIMFNHDPSLALAAYNWGMGNVTKKLVESGGQSFSSIKENVPEETRNYVKRIMTHNFMPLKIR